MLRGKKHFFIVVASAAAIALGVSACGDLPATPPPEASDTTLAPVVIGILQMPTALQSGADAVEVALLLPGGPAEAGGLREDDVLLSVAGNPVRSMGDLEAALKGAPAGVAVAVAILRDGQPMTVEVKPETRAPDFNARFNQAIADRIGREEAAAAQDEATGANRTAFDHDIKALRLIGLGRSAVPDARQRFDGDLARVGALLPKLKPPPAVPPEAERFSDRAIDILRQAHSDADNDAASRAFGDAIFAAPWVADLYRDYGLVLAKSGKANAGSIDLNRYLLLDPGAADAPAMRQKIADLAELAEEQGPVTRFVGTQTLKNGQTERLSLRGHTLVVSILKPPAPPDPESVLQPDDTLCAGTISGTHFAGHCIFVSSDPRFIACFGDRRDFPADGDIEGNFFKIQGIVYVHYHSESCVIDEQRRGLYRTYAITN